jgi:tetratricopeptide (TPR) repeat protein
VTQLAEKLQRALALHQQGDLEHAQFGYEEILNLQPGHFDALHLLGVMAGQRKDYQRAATLIGEALQIDPANAAAYCNRGAALKEHRCVVQPRDGVERASAV